MHILTLATNLASLILEQATLRRRPVAALRAVATLALFEWIRPTIACSLLHALLWSTHGLRPFYFHDVPLPLVGFPALCLPLMNGQSNRCPRTLPAVNTWIGITLALLPDAGSARPPP